MSDEPDTCPECGSTRLHRDERRGELVCRVCGAVVEAPGLEPDRDRRADGPTRGRPRRSVRLDRAERWARSSTGSERRLIEASQEVRRIGTALNCPRDVADEAVRLVSRAQDADLTQGRALDAVAAAALMASCRLLYLSRTEDEVAAVARAEKEAVRAAYKALVNGLRLPVPPMTAHEYLASLASKLDADPSILGRANDVLQDVCGTRAAAGKNPLGWAAAAIVVASREVGQAISLNAAGRAAGVSASTVAARVRELASIAASEE